MPVRPGSMRRIGFVTVLVALAVSLLPAFAQAGQDTCGVGEGQYKYDVDTQQWEPSDPGIVLVIVPDEDGEADSITVPEGWIIVCAKAGTELTHPNGRTVDMKKAISHIVIERVETPPEPYNGSFLKLWEGDEVPDGVEVTFTVRIGDGEPFEVRPGELIEYPEGEFPVLISENVTGLPEGCEYQSVVGEPVEVGDDNYQITVTNDLECVDETTTTTEPPTEPTTTPTKPDEAKPVVVTNTTIPTKVLPISESLPSTVSDTVVEVLPFTGVRAQWAWLAGGLTLLGTLLLLGARRDETA